jgi:hypothetical protein
MALSELRAMVAELKRLLFPHIIRVPAVALHDDCTHWGWYRAIDDKLSLHEQLAASHPLSDIASTCVHELAHCQCWAEKDYHGPAWQWEMHRCGLHPQTHAIYQTGPLGRWLWQQQVNR